MEVFKNRLILVFAIAFISVVVISIVLICVYGFDVASDISSIIGGLTSPILSLSALIMIVTTYFYQKKQDDINSASKIVNEQFKFLRKEFQGIFIINNISKNTIINGQSNSINETKKITGVEAMDFTGYILNRSKVDKKDWQDTMLFKSIESVLEGLDNLISEIENSKPLSDVEKNVLLSSIKVFYINNIYVESMRKAYSRTMEDQKAKNVVQLGEDLFWYPEKIRSSIQSINSKLDVNIQDQPIDDLFS